jgi:2-keto-3-deoxy-L-rhamnonate aldolase RhmA
MSENRNRNLRSIDARTYGVLITFHSPELVELYGELGFQWLLLDAEHTPLSAGTCRELTRAADLVGMPCMVRLPEIRASTIEGFLDVGVSGVLASGVESADDVHALIDIIKFPPHGRRGSASISRAARFGLLPPAEHMRRSNESTMVAALIESRRAIDELDAILAIRELDCVAIGPNDLGLSLGLVGGESHPQVRTLVDGAQQSIRTAGKRQLAVATDAAAVHRAVTEGATLIAVPDASLIASAGRDFLSQANRATGVS